MIKTRNHIKVYKVFEEIYESNNEKKSPLSLNWSINELNEVLNRTQGNEMALYLIYELYRSEAKFSVSN